MYSCRIRGITAVRVLQLTVAHQLPNTHAYVNSYTVYMASRVCDSTYLRAHASLLTT
jgi:hypothetical protein